MKDPDFITQAVDNANRFESATTDSHRYQTRLLEKKKAFWNEIIELKLVHDAQGSTRNSATTWKIPRFRLTKEMLEDASNRARMQYLKDNETNTETQMSRLSLSDQPIEETKFRPLMLSHIYHVETSSVIMPDQMQSQCRASPACSYQVILRSAGGVFGGGLLSSCTSSRRKHITWQNDNEMQVHYDGDLAFYIHNVPERSNNKQYEVTSDDIRRWIVDGAIKDDASMTLPSKRLLDLQQTLDKLQREYRSLMAMESPVDMIKRDIDMTKKHIRNTELALESARETHFADCCLSILKLPNEKKIANESSSSWKVSVRRNKKEYYQKLIEKNNKWSLVPLYAFGDPEDSSKRKSKSKSQQQFTMSVPKSEQVDHFVDVGGVKIEKLPDGFGVYESYAASSIANDGDDANGQHRLYHGNFAAGRMQGKGSLYSTEGFYSGAFRNDERVGYGKIEYSDSITLSGEFALPGRNQADTESKDEKVNPYSRGLPNGECSYSSKKRKEPKKFLGEIEGEWNKGYLQNNEGIEGGQGCSLLRSLMFGGERLWGPQA
eukprot:scaffold18965_cov72-Cyclotella_meneghiniana.AAC.6